MPASFDAQLALCSNKPMHGHLTSLRASNVVSVSPRSQYAEARGGSPHTYPSDEAQRLGFGASPAMQPPAEPSLGYVSTGSPTLFSNLGRPPSHQTKARTANLFAPGWQGPASGWATELLPSRPATTTLSLTNKNQPPITDSERMLPCWKDLGSPPRPHTPRARRDPINGMSCEESGACPLSSVTTSRAFYGYIEQ